MKKKTLYIILGCVFLAAAVFFGVKLFQSTYAPKSVITESMSVTPSPEPISTPEVTAPPAADATPEPTETPEPTPTPYAPPVDFESLQEVNPDIYGWIKIEDTNIDFPVVQSADDDGLYLNHNSDGDYSANGSIFSEHEYNSTDFKDPVTILYGHHQWDGAMFGRLQQYYSDPDFWEEDHVITIYTPEEELTYGVFAAVPFSGDHILYYNDFTDDSVFSNFFEGVMNTRDLSAHFNEEYVPEVGDHVLILSTCLIGNNTNRFLVMGTLLPSDQ